MVYIISCFIKFLAFGPYTRAIFNSLHGDNETDNYRKFTWLLIGW